MPTAWRRGGSAESTPRLADQPRTTGTAPPPLRQNHRHDGHRRPTSTSAFAYRSSSGPPATVGRSINRFGYGAVRSFLGSRSRARRHPGVTQRFGQCTAPPGQRPRADLTGVPSLREAWLDIGAYARVAVRLNGYGVVFGALPKAPWAWLSRRTGGGRLQTVCRRSD